MAVMIECLLCHRKQAVKNKRCGNCGDDLDRQKRLRETVEGPDGQKMTKGKSRYYIRFPKPGGKRSLEFIGYSLQEARDAYGKRRVQKREKRVFDMMPGTDKTFEEMGAWYLDLEDVKEKGNAVRSALKCFNEEFGNWIVLDLKATDLENWQRKMLKAGKAPSTVHTYRNFAQTMLNKAERDNMIDIRSLKPFKGAKRVFSMGQNARDRTATRGEFEKLLTEVAPHIKPMMIASMHTGMRQGELRKLTWAMIDREKWVARLPGEITKNGKPRSIPLNHHVQAALKALPRPIAGGSARLHLQRATDCEGHPAGFQESV